MVRKLIEFEDDVMDALKLQGAERMKSVQELADEAFRDLIKKHGGGLSVREALRKSMKEQAHAKAAPKPALKSGKRRRVARGD